MRRVSIADVAARAGVSGQTVSRVVNGSPRVLDSTRARVEAAMAEIGYRPNRAARALRTGRTQTIGLVVATLAAAENSRMLEAIAESTGARGYALTVVTIGQEGLGRAFERLEDQGVDGVIVLNEASPSLSNVILPRGARVVGVDAAPMPGMTSLETDHLAGARAATEYLLELGHATVWHLGGPAASHTARAREEGWRAALHAAGIVDPAVVRGEWTASSGYAAASELREATAIFCANDQMALGALRGLAEAGRRVPEDVSVIGFDDLDDASHYQPPLTTVRQYFDVLAERAVAALVAEIEDGVPMPERIVVPAILAVRASTAPVAHRPVLG
ncbi:LacI family DNA-binding transcriptional regulator [Microbacterium sp. X-17]|uniref:LacI family DNA-binding transcriptional regulator n=1 Tax=Microbacterium sp. X-17 TaxID=3144404 RepID=UPI0031F54B14